ncbi:MAG: PAC2 family protein [Dehalococcoidia bacterium]|jgi:hypothetical protein|nr:PAC2 family protein [Dehalococcoidia bacterium]
MNEPLHEALKPLEELGPLNDPVLLASFSGWGDNMGSAAATLEYLTKQWEATPIAEIAPELFFDFTVQRPRVRLEDGERVLDWPALRFHRARPPGGERDFVLLSGPEPSLRWQTFTEAIAGLMKTVGATTSVTLGAQPAAVPHTRPLPVTLSASHPEFEQQFGLEIRATSRYQGPVGIVSVLNLHHRDMEWRNAHLRVMAPHYLTMGPNPNVATTLVKTIDHGFGVSTPLGPLEERVEAFADQVREAMQESSEAESYVTQLEEQYDENQPQLPTFDAPAGEPGSGNLPAADDLLSDLENFLRERRQDE